MVDDFRVHRLKGRLVDKTGRPSNNNVWPKCNDCTGIFHICDLFANESFNQLRKVARKINDLKKL